MMNSIIRTYMQQPSIQTCLSLNNHMQGRKPQMKSTWEEKRKESMTNLHNTINVERNNLHNSGKL